MPRGGTTHSSQGSEIPSFGRSRQSFARIRRLPRAFPANEGGVHSALLHRFPYAVLFRIQEKRIEVIAVWHGHRDPKGLRPRLSP